MAHRGAASPALRRRKARIRGDRRRVRYEGQFRGQASLRYSGRVVDVGHCRGAFPDSMDCVRSIGACSTRLASDSLGSWSHVAGGSNFVVLVLSVLQSLLAAGRSSARVADIMGQAIAKTRRHVVRHATASSDLLHLPLNRCAVDVN
jgi:hypothetical protein